MSSLIVRVVPIASVRPHPNADALELATLLGWQCVVPKGKYRDGDLVVYIPIDTMIPEGHSDRWGFTKYLSKGRVRCARLRGEPSFGVVIDREQDWPEGTDVAEFYGITKYEPPIRMNAGDSERDDPHFITYTDLENLRNFPDVLTPGELVGVTEKLHGTNSRVGCVGGVLMAGSKGLRRRRPENDRFDASLYWFPFTLAPVREMVESLGLEHRVVILYGEIYGSRIQSLDYGEQGTLGFRAFDLYLDGKYADRESFVTACRQYGVDTVPHLYEGPFSLEKIQELAGGNTTLGADHIREGVVVKPLEERHDPRTGRVALKYLNDEYLLKKEGGKVTDSMDQ